MQVMAGPDTDTLRRSGVASGSLVGKVLVLGEDTRSFLAVIRSLGRKGLEVHVAWCPLKSAALKSRYIRSRHQLPEYRSDDDSWLKALNALIRDERFELILPCTDGTILPLQMHRRQIENESRIQLLPDDVYRVCSSKAETYLLAQELGIPLPRQATICSMKDASNAAREFGFPLILKPQTSSSIVNPLVRQVVRRIDLPEDLTTCAEIMLGDGNILVQQNFEGTGVGVEVLCKDGTLLTAFQHERVHEPLAGGGSSYRKSVALHPGMLDVTKRLMGALHYTGIAMVEWKHNQETGAWVLIEINARFWGSLPLSVAAGLDFPYYLYQMMCQGRTDFPQKYRSNLYSRHWSTDLEWMIANFRERNSGALTVPGLQVAAEIVNLLRLRERSDTFTLDDPGPALGDLRGFWRDKTFAITKRASQFRKWKQQRALKAIRKSRNILFVCYGNICRSPFAAAVLRNIAPPGLTASCSGYFPQAQRLSPDAAAEAACRFGVDLARHRSSVLTQDAINAADLIFVFDRRTMDALESRFTDLGCKIHFLGALDPVSRLEIEDPYGGSMEQFVECYTRIAQILKCVFSKELVPPA